VCIRYEQARYIIRQGGIIASCNNYIYDCCCCYCENISTLLNFRHSFTVSLYRFKVYLVHCGHATHRTDRGNWDRLPDFFVGFIF